jgi:hypothetical protein
MSNAGSLPQIIPPQTASLGKADAEGNVTIDITWYLLLYNLTTQVLNAANGSLTITPIDLLLLDGADIAETTETESTGNGVDTVDIDALGADVAQLQPGQRDVDSTDIDAAAADAAQLLSMLQMVQALIADIIDSASPGIPGNVAGPASAVSGNVALFDGTTGKLLKDGGTLGTAAFTASSAYLASGGTAANSSQLLGATWSTPGSIGSGTPAAGAFTTLAGTLSTAAQPNVTSVGSTGLTVGGGAVSTQIFIDTSAGHKGYWYADATSMQFGAQTGIPIDFLTTNTARLSIAANGAITTNGNSLTAGAISGTTTIKTGGYTVATLPAGVVGMRAYVTDAVAPTFLGVLVGGGTVTTPVFYNGSSWVSD